LWIPLLLALTAWRNSSIVVAVVAWALALAGLLWDLRKALTAPKAILNHHSEFSRATRQNARAGK
jgi:uncharacterized membrane protein YqjE